MGRLMLHRPADRARARWAIALLELKPEDHVLDVGIGPGYSTGLIAAAVSAGVVVGVDQSALMTDMARRRLRRHLKARKVTLVCADASDLPRFDVTFDKALAIDALAFEAEPSAEAPTPPPDPRAILAHLHSRMTPGGRIAVVAQPRDASSGSPGAQALGSRIADCLRAAGFERPDSHFNSARRGAPSVCVTARA